MASHSKPVGRGFESLLRHTFLQYACRGKYPGAQRASCRNLGYKNNPCLEIEAEVGQHWQKKNNQPVSTFHVGSLSSPSSLGLQHFHVV